jgi:putative phosphoribosyl transferase
LQYDESISASDDSNYQERRVLVWGGPVQLEGILTTPQDAHAVVVIPYDRMGNWEHSLNELASASRRAGLATLLVNLLTPEDEVVDKTTGFLRENVNVLHKRVLGITNWLIADAEPRSITIGYFGVGVSAAAALAAAARRPDAVHAIVAVAPRIDLVSAYLPRIATPTLLIAGERDRQALDMSHKALAELTSDTTLDIVRAAGNLAHTTLDVVREARERGLAHTLEVVPGVADVFENEQSLHHVEQLATWWFTSHLSV